MVMVREELQTMNAQELRAVIDEAKQLLKRKKLYIREIGKPSGDGHHVYLYATWQEEGKTRQKSLGRKHEDFGNTGSANQSIKFRRYGVNDSGSIAFLEAMVERGYLLAN
ncbi:MAG: hypothetical protein R2932_20780 [Caldilineaceae bacterium]